MKKIIDTLGNLKLRYYIALLTVITSVLLTPVAIKAAYEFRGYRAVGGEYLLIPLGVVIAYIIIEIATEIDSFKKKKTTN